LFAGLIARKRKAPARALDITEATPYLADESGV
jgi:hypothetical protein